MKFCPECGGDLKESRKFCPECGSNVGRIIGWESTSEATPDNRSGEASASRIGAFPNTRMPETPDNRSGEASTPDDLSADPTIEKTARELGTRLEDAVEKILVD